MHIAPTQVVKKQDMSNNLGVTGTIEIRHSTAFIAVCRAVQILVQSQSCQVKNADYREAKTQPTSW